MTIENLEKELNTGKLDKIYLFYGEETYLLETALKKIKKTFGECIQGINYIQIDETNIDNLIPNIQTPAFGYEKKLIIVKANLFKKGKKKKNEDEKEDQEEDIEEKLKNDKTKQNIINEYFIKNIDEIEGTTILFIEEDIDSKKELYKTIEKNGIVLNFEKLNLSDIINRIKKICNMYEVSIDNIVVQYFIETCGTNIQSLINEIRKLIEYKGKNGIITKEDVDKLSTRGLESRIFDLTDSLGKKQTKRSLKILKELIYNKEPIQKILITLYNHFKKIYLVKLALRYNEDVANALKLKQNQNFLIPKYRKQATYFKEEEIKKILDELINLDNSYKSGKIDINIGLEAILCNYC